MPTENVWADPRTWTAIGSLAIGFLGLLYGVLSGSWNRRESRLDALSNVLQPLAKAAQALHLANNCRRRCEQLKLSFPDSNSTPDATRRVNELVAEYDEYVKSAHTEFRAAEAEFAARSFRFPDKIAALVRIAQESLSEFGRLVNQGMFDKADLQLVKFRDDYKKISKEGRGWRLADPLEGFMKRFRRKINEEPLADKYDITEKSMNEIMEMVHKRATTQADNSFAVHPPKKLLDHPEIAQSDNVIEELEDSVFVVAFQDGTARMMTLPELMMFVFNLITLQAQLSEVSRMIQAVPNSGQTTVQVSFQLSMHEIMRSEMVKLLLTKIKFSDSPCDG